MCTICLFDPPAHAPWCPIKDQDTLREMAQKKAEMEENTKLRSDAISNFQRIAELEAENSKLKVSIEHARSDALSNLERLIFVEAENAKLSDRVGSLTFDNDLLRRGAADDALTIHTCEEIIDRVKKENGDFRAKNSDLEKENVRLRALVERGGNLSEGVSRWQTTFVLECREALK